MIKKKKYIKKIKCKESKIQLKHLSMLIIFHKAERNQRLQIKKKKNLTL